MAKQLPSVIINVYSKAKKQQVERLKDDRMSGSYSLSCRMSRTYMLSFLYLKQEKSRKQTKFKISWRTEVPAQTMNPHNCKESQLWKITSNQGHTLIQT